MCHLTCKSGMQVSNISGVSTVPRADESQGQNLICKPPFPGRSGCFVFCLLIVVVVVWLSGREQHVSGEGMANDLNGLKRLWAIVNNF